MNTFASILIEARKKQKLSQQEVADILGMSQRGYSHYEKVSEGRIPEMDILIKLLDALDFRKEYEEFLRDAGILAKNVPLTKEVKEDSQASEIIPLLKDQKKLTGEVLTNLESISRGLVDVYNEQVLTRAEVRGFGQYQVMKDANFQDTRFSEIMVQVRKLVGANLTVNDQTGNQVVQSI